MKTKIILSLLMAFQINISEAIQMSAVKRDPLSIKQIANPSPKVQIEAMLRNPKAYHHIKNPTKDVELMAWVYGRLGNLTIKQ